MYVKYVTSQYVGDIIFQQGVTKCDEGEGGGKNMAKKAWRHTWTAPYLIGLIIL